jgi:hypothetical protein
VAERILFLEDRKEWEWEWEWERPRLRADAHEIGNGRRFVKCFRDRKAAGFGFWSESWC